MASINLRIEELEKGRMDDEAVQEMEQLMTEIPEKFAIIQDKELRLYRFLWCHSSRALR